MVTFMLIPMVIISLYLKNVKLGIDLMPRINEMGQHIDFCNYRSVTQRRLSRACANVLIPPSLLSYPKNRCRLSLRPEISPTVSALAHI